jgi:type II secretory pathway pseudopilin PulG
MRRAEAGFQLVEILVALALVAFAAGIATPPVLRALTGLEVRLAAGEVASALRLARAYAIAHDTHVGLKFRTAANGVVTWTVYRDGDGDGVRTEDIERGVDPRVAPPFRLAHFGRRIRFGFPPGPPPRDPGDPRRRLDRLEDPIRFNRSDIASFGPLSGATPGSVYVTDGTRHLTVVRLTSVTARTRLLEYDPEREVWRP